MTHAVSGTQGMTFSLAVEGRGSLFRRPGGLPLGDVRLAGLIPQRVWPTEAGVRGGRSRVRAV